MKTEIKTKWLSALRSGEYTQQFNVIGNGKHLCCIGVGADAIGAQTPEWYTDDAVKALGLSEGQKYKLIELNDTYQKSFNEIADWIEANIPTES